MDPLLHQADLEAKPAALRSLAAALAASDPWAALPPTRRLVLLGMGSSRYASAVAAARLRSRGLDAVAEYASSDLLPGPADGTVVVAVSAGGGSRETRAAIQAYRGRCPVVLLTNTPDSALSREADLVVPMQADVERGGVACRSFTHSQALLMALESHLTGDGRDIAALVARAADACDDLLTRTDTWLPAVTDLLAAPHGTHSVAPARRLSSAQQSALMMREGPRRPAVGCETGDWSHVDVYLTKTTDYRLLLFAGSRWEDELLHWTTERGSTVVAVGAEVADAAMTVRYRGDDEDDVRLLAEVLVGELLAARLWAADSQDAPAAVGLVAGTPDPQR